MRPDGICRGPILDIPYCPLSSALCLCAYVTLPLRARAQTCAGWSEAKVLSEAEGRVEGTVQLFPPAFTAATTLVANLFISKISA